MVKTYRFIGKSPKELSLQEMHGRYGISVVSSKDVSSAETMEIIHRWHPDVVVSIYINQIIKKDLICLPLLGCVNIHPSLLPRNKGLIPYFWAVANGDNKTGATLHWIDEKFDTGKIILQEVIPIEDKDTVNSLAFKSAQVGAKLVIRGLDLIEAGKPPHIQQDQKDGSYYSWPRPADLRRFRKRGGKWGSIFKRF